MVGQGKYHFQFFTVDHTKKIINADATLTLIESCKSECSFPFLPLFSVELGKVKPETLSQNIFLPPTQTSVARLLFWLRFFLLVLKITLTAHYHHKQSWIQIPSFTLIALL